MILALLQRMVRLGKLLDGHDARVERGRGFEWACDGKPNRADRATLALGFQPIELIGKCFLGFSLAAAKSNR
jgi:hypothetical protein